MDSETFGSQILGNTKDVGGAAIRLADDSLARDQKDIDAR